MALSLAIDPIHPPQPLALLAPSAMTILLVCKGYEPCVPALYDLDHFRGLINTDIINALQYINGLLPAYFSHLPFTLQPKSFKHEIWIGTQSNKDPWPALQQYYAEANGPYMKLNLRHQEFESWDTLVVMVQGVVCVDLFTQWTLLRCDAFFTQYEALTDVGQLFGPLPTYKRDSLNHLNHIFDPHVVYLPPSVTMAAVPTPPQVKIQKIVDFAWYIPVWYFDLVWKIPTSKLEPEQWHELAVKMDYLRMATAPELAKVPFHRHLSSAIQILMMAWGDGTEVRASRLQELSCATYDRVQLLSGIGLISLSSMLTLSQYSKLSPAVVPAMVLEEEERDG
ncbi:hypothetical protein K439DRAFT_1612868 [Ramaria rubella]|nr:hypothetical protein K439DRAFT_1612868 [Ramaria rubella]